MKRPPPTTESRPWARHYQDEWASRAGDPRLPHWLRVTALAYSSHTDNGHARFKRGEVALILGRVDATTGEIQPHRNVARVIGEAIAYGWLAADSFWGCLVVPAHAIKKGSHGTASPCPIHVKRRRKNANNSLSEPFDSRSSTLSEPFEAQTPHSVSRSERNPLSLVLSPATTQRPAPERPAS